MPNDALTQIEPLMDQVLEICNQQKVCFMAFFLIPNVDGKHAGYETWRAAPEGITPPEKMLIANGLMVGMVEIRSMGAVTEEIKKGFVN